MMKNLSLQNKLSASFLSLGAIVLLVGTIGYISNVQLSLYIRDLAQDSLPSIDSLWQINQGLTQIQASEETLVNPKVTLDIRSTEVLKIEKSFEQVQEAFEAYTSRKFDDDEEEKITFKSLRALYQKWQSHYKEFMRIYKQYEQTGFKSQELLESLDKQEFTKNKPALEATNRTLIGLLNKEREEANWQQRSSTVQAHTNTLWLIITVIIGTGLSIILGILLSRSIAKPLSRSVRKIVNSIFILSEEITNVIGKQELMANQQAVSVNQTTVSMDEMSTSSQESARQAELSARGAKQVLSLAMEGNKKVNLTLEEMAILKAQVEDIANQIFDLKDQAHQIRKISNLVSEFSYRTNVIALNSALEAERAGEYGKGFAIVAFEVSKLANQSQQSAQSINQLVTELEVALNSAVKVTNQGTKTVDKGVDVAYETAQAFSSVADAINNIVINSQQISLTANQQAIAIKQVLEAMSCLNISAGQTAESISRVKENSEILNQTATHLKQMV